MTKYLVLRGERYIQYSNICEYQIHSVFSTAVNPNIQLEAFGADFLNYRKGVTGWTPENWIFSRKNLTIAAPIDGERVFWVNAPIVEHLYKPCYYLFVEQDEVLRLFK